MKYGWFIRGKRTKLFVRVQGSVLLALETPHEATMFPSEADARACIGTLVMAPELEVVDYAIHEPSPPNADQTPVRTREQVIQDALNEDMPREAQRRATWGLVEKAVAVLALCIACLTGGLAPTTATASPRDNLFPPTIGATQAHDSHRAAATRPHAHARHRSAGRRAGPHAGDSSVGSPLAWGPLNVASNAVAIAERFLGTNPTGHRSLWCADFANLIEHQLGRRGTNSREAVSFLRYGPHVNNPAPGDLVVLGRHGGGHVGYFIQSTPRGPLVVSGNHNHAVGIGVYDARQVLAYVRPS